MLSHKKYLNDKELKYLRKLLDENRHDVYAVIMALALCTGARRGEILRLTKEDFSDTSVAITPLKSSNPRELPVPRFIVNFVRNSDKKLPFDVPRSTLHWMWQRYTPNKNKTFHSLRHTFAMQLYKKSKDIRLVKYALGHKDIRNTMIYQDYSYQVNEIREFF